MDKKAKLLLGAGLVAALAQGGGLHADEFTRQDLERWQQEYMAIVDKGERLFHGGLGNANTVSCDQCHPNAANTHPETYPKFQKQLGRSRCWER